MGEQPAFRGGGHRTAPSLRAPGDGRGLGSDSLSAVGAFPALLPPLPFPGRISYVISLTSQAVFWAQDAFSPRLACHRLASESWEQGHRKLSVHCLRVCVCESPADKGPFSPRALL